MGKLKVGDAAPAFRLKNQANTEVSLASFKGERNVVLYFYPKAMTPGCTVQACALRDSLKEFDRREAVVLGVSPDEPARLEKFTEKDGLNFTLLSDPNNQAAKAYGAWGKKMFMGRSYMGILRMSFIIGKDGFIRHILEKVNTKTHHEDVLKLLGAL